MEVIDLKRRAHRAEGVGFIRRHAAWVAIASLGLTGFAAGFIYNGATLAQWHSSTSTSVDSIIVGNVSMAHESTSTLVDVGRWDNTAHIQVASQVPLATVNIQPRTTIDYTSTFKAVIAGDSIKSEVSCALVDSGYYSPLTQSTGIKDAANKSIPIGVVTWDAPVKIVNGSIITAHATLTHPATTSFYEKSGESRDLPQITCTISQVR